MILLVDSHPVNRKLLRFALENESFKVQEAGNGTEALQALEKDRYDCIISEVLIPDMDGYLFTYTVRKDPRFSGIPVILYSSSHDSPGDEKLSLEAGAYKFIPEPALPEEILEAARKLVLKKKQTRIGAVIKIPNEMDIIRNYGKVLVRKLEQKNGELAAMRVELENAKVELQRFNHSMADRELRMIELKKQVNKLSAELGRDPLYDLVFFEPPSGEKK